MKKPHFEKKETYKHRAAIEVLTNWLDMEVRHEQKFYLDGAIAFVPDITCYENGEVVAFYEVYHSHEIEARKLAYMHEWIYRNQSPAGIYEISAEWILRQMTKPEALQLTDMSILI